MIKNEQQLKQESIRTAMWGSVLCALVSLISQEMSILLGYGLGIMISYLMIEIDCQATSGLLKSQFKRSYLISFMFYFFKLGIYAIGFFIAVKIPVAFNLFGVFVGYLNTKLTIYRLALTRR